MKKAIPYLFITVFVAIACFVLAIGFQVLKPQTQLQKEANAKDLANYVAHHKEIGTDFLIDSIAYNFTNFKYIKKEKSTVLIVDIEINNKTNHSKKYEAHFFSAISNSNITYYPTGDPFTVFENKTQKTKLIYYLPELILPYITSDVTIHSKNDTTQYAFVRCYKTYRAEG